MISGTTRVRGLGWALAGMLAGCDVAPDAARTEPQPDPVGTTQAAVSACNQFGLPDPGTCSSCSRDASGNWVQTCVTADCTFSQRACTPPIVSCGVCSYQFLSRTFTQTCTRADGVQVVQPCEPPRLPPRPWGMTVSKASLP